MSGDPEGVAIYGYGESSGRSIVSGGRGSLLAGRRGCHSPAAASARAGVLQWLSLLTVRITV